MVSIDTYYTTIVQSPFILPPDAYRTVYELYSVTLITAVFSSQGNSTKEETLASLYCYDYCFILSLQVLKPAFSRSPIKMRKFAKAQVLFPGEFEVGWHNSNLLRD